MLEIARRRIAGVWRTGPVEEENGGSQPLLQTDPIPVSSAELLALPDTDIEIVPSPGPGFAVVPIAVTWVYLAGDTPYDSDHNLDIDWDGDSSHLITLNGGLFRADDRLSVGAFTNEARKAFTLCEDKALVLGTEDATITDGNGTGIIQATYIIVPLSA